MKPNEPPEFFNFAEDVLGKQAEEFPDRTAILSVDEQGNETRWTFASLHEESSRLAHVLQAGGVARGDIVPIMVASLAHGTIARLAVMKAGGVSLLMRAQATAREIAHFTQLASPRLAIVGPEGTSSFPGPIEVIVTPSAELASDLHDAPTAFASLRLRSDEPEHLVPTGGTTGMPKLVVHTHGSRLFHHWRWTMSFEADDLSWDLAGRWWIGAWRTGTPVFDLALPRGSTAEVVLEALARYPITKFMGPARLYSELLRGDIRADSFPTLRYCCSGGQALDPNVARSWKERTGLSIFDRYGQSECGEAPFEPLDEIGLQGGCLGRAFPWIDMAVIDQEGERLPVGELGDIAISIKPVRPPWLFREYLGDPEATAARHRGDWYLTGDIGRMDQAGFFFMAGRADDIINCGGTNIGPWELESVLLGHPAVREAAVVGKPHRDLGEIPKAFVVAETGAVPTEELAADLIRFVNEAIHPHKALREVAFASDLPRTPEGKLRRGPLREQE